MEKTFLFVILTLSFLGFAPHTLTANAFPDAILSTNKHTQVEAANFDFDDNVFVTSAKNMLWDKSLNKEVGITTAEWAVVRDKLGKEGEWKERELRPQSLRYFSDTTEQGGNLFKNQIIEALDNKNKEWKGPQWQNFADALSDPKRRAKVTIITARLHSPANILKGLQVLKDRGLLSALPDVENIFPVGWPKLPEAFKGKDSSDSKAKVMLTLLDNLEKTPLEEGQKHHSWGFSDDDFENYSKALTLLSSEAEKKRWPHVKLVFSFTGLNNPKEKPRVVTIKPNGKVTTL